MHASPLLRRQMMDTALGKRPADLVITHADVADVYTGRFLPGRSVAVCGPFIAYVGPDADFAIGPDTRCIDAAGRVLAPGYMDTHTHLATHWDLADFLAYAIPCGLTTIVTEVESYGFALGAEGVWAFLDQIRSAPINLYALIPPLLTISPAARGRGISAQAARRLLEDDQVIGLGESYWQDAVLNPNDPVLALVAETVRARKSVQGHAAGAFDRKLSAYAAMGAVSCHEAIAPGDVLVRLEMGFHAMIRDGGIRQDLDIIAPLKDTIDFRRLILVTDGTSPDLLRRQGYLVDVLQKAVALGLDPIRIIQMVTLNPAEHFRLDHLTGGIAPGRLADLVILPDRNVMQPDTVLARGRVVAEHGRLAIDLPRVPPRPALLETVRLPHLGAGDFKVPAPSTAGGDSVRTMDIQPGGLVTREGQARPPRTAGAFAADPEADLLKIVFIERVSGRGERWAGFLRGWGQRRGAVATSLCWDVAGIVAVGSDDRDLAAAVNRVVAHMGGTVLVVDGESLVDIAFPVAGYVSQLGIPALADELQRFTTAVQELGCALDDPLLTLYTLTTASIPFIRIMEKGYHRFRENDVVGL